MKEQEIVHGFRVVRRRELQQPGEPSCALYEFEHVKTGACVVWDSSPDDWKSFLIGFRTPVEDDSGIAHVTEHAICCGSRKYPVKNLMGELIKSNSSAGINAFTSFGMTGFHFESPYDHEFQSFADVFLDAVFHPMFLTEPRIFAQQGWHYEIAAPDAPLRRVGVVFSEVREGRGMWRTLQQVLAEEFYPHAQQKFEPGGTLAGMPELTQERLVAFHQRYYHPSNCCLLLTGTLAIEEMLAYLDASYFSAYERRTPITFPSGPAVHTPFRAVTRTYPRHPDAKAFQGSTFVLAWQLENIDDPLDWFRLSILRSLLFSSPTSPVMKAMEAAGFAPLLSAKLAPFDKDMAFLLLLEEQKPEDAERFQQVILQALRDVGRQGLPHQELASAFDMFEYHHRLTEEDDDTSALTNSHQMFKNWVFGKDVYDGFLRDEEILRLRDGIEQGAFERTFERCFLAKEPAMLLTLTPSADLFHAREAEEERRLFAQKAAMSAEELRAVHDAAAELRSWQEAPEAPELLARLPKRTLEDARKTYRMAHLDEETFCGAKLLTGTIDAEGVFHIEFDFDASALSPEELVTLKVFVNLLPELETVGQGSDAFLTSFAAAVQHFHTRIGFALDGDKNEVRPSLELTIGGLARKLPDIFAALETLLFEATFTDKKRIRELLSLAQRDLQHRRLSDRGKLSFVTTRNRAHDTGYDRASRELNQAFYALLERCEQDFETAFPRLQQRLIAVRKRILDRHHLSLFLGASKKDAPRIRERLAAFLAKLPDTPRPATLQMRPLERKDEAFRAQGKLQYISKGKKFDRQGRHLTGPMVILEQILENDYLEPRVRQTGGAYIVGADARWSGGLFFYSGRDPHLARTVDIFDGAADFVRNLDMTEDDLVRAIVGSISYGKEKVTSLGACLDAYIDWRMGVTEADHQGLLDEKRRTTLADLRALAPLVEECITKGGLVVYGNDAMIERHRELFDMVQAAPF